MKMFLLDSIILFLSLMLLIISSPVWAITKLLIKLKLLSKDNQTYSISDDMVHLALSIISAYIIFVFSRKVKK